ncbi:MAG: BlaI/MecI/CopY family transcriptional regulator [Pseudonocardiaceae bacterium]
MDVLWERGEPTVVRDVARALVDRDLAYTTVMTVLDRLAKKGVVQRNRDGRSWRYVAAASREAFIAQLMLDALSLTGDRPAALTHFALSVGTPDATVLSRALAAASKKPDSSKSR